MSSNVNRKIVLISENVKQRWRHSARFPAYGRRAKGLLLPIRLGIALRCFPCSRIDEGRYSLVRGFIDEAVPGARPVSVATSRQPVKRLVVILEDDLGPRACLKYAEDVAHVSRLKGEAAALHSLPKGLGPRVLKSGELLDGYGLLTEFIEGEHVGVRLAADQKVVDFARRLMGPVSFDIDDHPWIRKLEPDAPEDLHGWLVALSDRSWPASGQHGDFVPWNLLVTRDGVLRAIDWEFYDPLGFPYLDHAYYALRICQSVHRNSPSDALRKSVSALRLMVPELTMRQADAIVRLAALDFFRKAVADGQTPDNAAQRWRMELIRQPAAVRTK